MNKQKIQKLTLNRETVKVLSDVEAMQVKGGENSGGCVTTAYSRIDVGCNGKSRCPCGDATVGATQTASNES